MPYRRRKRGQAARTPRAYTHTPPKPKAPKVVYEYEPDPPITGNENRNPLTDVNPGDCEHVKEFIRQNGTTAYEVICAAFVVCITEEFRQRKIKECFCYKCKIVSLRLYACMYCVFIGCKEENHIRLHAEKERHHLAVDVTFGTVHCFLCQDAVYSPNFEEVERTCQSVVTPSMFYFWKPSYNDLLILQKYSKNWRKITGSGSYIGIRGLLNMKNTCYLSVIIQIFVHTPGIRDYFLSGGHVCTKKHNLMKHFVCAMNNLFQEAYSGKRRPHAPYKLFYCFWSRKNNIEFLAAFNDVSEILLEIFDFLHTDLIGKKENVIDRNCTCLVHRLFYGIEQSELKCQKCQFKTTSFELFSFLSLTMAQKNRDQGNKASKPESLLDCLARYTEPVVTDCICSRCKEKGDNQAKLVKRVSIEKLPVVAICYLVRFSGAGLKDNTKVFFPEELDLTPYTSASIHADGPQSRSPANTFKNRYSLYGVISHLGRHANGGHYICYVKHAKSCWLKCNDRLIKRAVCPGTATNGPTSSENVLEAEGWYMLFYHKDVLDHGKDIAYMEL